MIDICLPCYESIDPLTFVSFMRLKVPGPHILYMIEGDPDIVGVRNELARKVSKGTNEFSLWVDADINFPPSTLVNLLDALLKEENSLAGIATGIYRGRTSPHEITVFRATAHPVQNMEYNFLPAYPPIDEPEPYLIDACGAGCMLVRNKLFRDGINFNKVGAYSEDVSFCIKAKSAGYQILACPDVTCGHRGKVNISY